MIVCYYKSEARKVTKAFVLEVQMANLGLNAHLLLIAHCIAMTGRNSLKNNKLSCKF